MAIQALVTTEGSAAANAANASGFTVTIPQFSVSAVPGTFANSRTFTSRNATWFSAVVTAATTVSATTVKYTCTIPPGATLAATPIKEIYLEDVTGSKLYVIGVPDAASPITYDPAGSVTIEIDVTISSIPSSSYNLFNVASIDLVTHESNAAMHPKSNYGAITIPTVNDDAAAGYNEGSIWVNTITNTAYVLTSKTNGAAVWDQIAPQTTGVQNNFAATLAPSPSNDSGQGYGVGSVWIDIVADTVYTLTDPSVGAAIWEQTAGATAGAVVAPVAPATPVPGIVWLNTSNDVTYVYDGASWIDISAAGAGQVKNNFAAASDPTPLADSNAGYAIGSTWVNVATGSSYVATSVAAGAATWSRFGNAVKWLNKASNYTINANEGIFVDTTGLALTMTLPATPVAGTTVQLLDSRGTWATNNVTVARNGNTIMGAAANHVLNTNNQLSTFYYTGSDWRVISSIDSAAAASSATVAAVAPTTPASGDIWFDTVNTVTYLWDGTAWIDVTAASGSAGSAATVAAVAPTTPATGDIWFDTANSVTYLWDGTAWIDVTAAAGAPSTKVATVNPTVSADSSLGYASGSQWINSVLNTSYICISAAVGAAVWNRTS